MKERIFRTVVVLLLALIAILILGLYEDRRDTNRADDYKYGDGIKET